jgi:hypothetical protein
MKQKNRIAPDDSRKVVSLPFICDSNIGENLNRRTSRQRHLKNRLIESVELGENSPVAAAVVLLRADGTIETAAIGVEPPVANRMATELERLARLSRRHARRYEAGFSSLSVLAPSLLSAASYINTIPWIDAALCLASHALAYWFARQRTAEH